MTKTTSNDNELLVISTPPFKLKDYPPIRTFQALHLIKQFGFAPEAIIIEKVRGHNNTFVIKAVLNDEQIKKHKELLKSNKKEK